MHPCDAHTPMEAVWAATAFVLPDRLRGKVAMLSLSPAIRVGRASASRRQRGGEDYGLTNVRAKARMAATERLFARSSAACPYCLKLRAIDCR